jgi:hypothetical protein
VSVNSLAVRAEKRVQKVTRPLRLKEVIGHDGRHLTLVDLPATNLKRWLPCHKASIVSVVRGGLITVDEICQRYGLSVEELNIWERALDRHGIKGLRVTKGRSARGSQ